MQFTGTGGKSPDRLDAACHAIRELMSYRTTATTGSGVVLYRDVSAADARETGVYRWAPSTWH